MKKVVLTVIILGFVFLGKDLYPVVKKAEKILNGKVLAINEKYDFIIVNLGKKDNVKKGMIFLIYRDNKLIGKAQVEEVFKDMSSCLVLPWIREEQIKRDDGVLKP
jgi:hypothetical protein